MTIIQPIAKLRRQAEKRNENMEGGMSWRVLDFLLYLLLVMAIVFAIRAVAFDPVRVDGTSMLDTLQENEIMFVNRLAYVCRMPQRGDIIICYYPEAYYEQVNKSYNSRVKRVAAVGGDTIETISGKVYVNGKKLDEPYLIDTRTGYQEIEKQVVPDGCVFVLGDNRAVSIDSRNEAVGPIPFCRIIGKVRGVIYPFDRIRKP